MTQEEINHLNFIYDRMVHVHKEHINVDYMRKFRHILRQEQTSLVENEKDSLSSMKGGNKMLNRHDLEDLATRAYDTEREAKDNAAQGYYSSEHGFQVDENYIWLVKMGNKQMTCSSPEKVNKTIQECLKYSPGLSVLKYGTYLQHRESVQVVDSEGFSEFVICVTRLQVDE